MFGSSSGTTKTAPATQLRIQTAVAGTARQILYGMQRVTGNLVWYGDFYSSSGGAGKGGSKGGGGGGKGGKGGGSSTTNYFASVVIGFCEGPASFTGNLWSDQGTLGNLGTLNLSGQPGSYSQGIWATGAGNIAYRGLCYAGAFPMPLGQSPTLPAFTVEIIGATDNPLGTHDAAPDFVLTDFLTNIHYGDVFPSAMIGSLTNYRNFCLAYGLVVSPALASQGAGNQFLTDLMTGTCSEVVWSGGLLTVVPYGDTALTANGYTFTPPSAPLYSLTDDDFKAPQGSNPNSVASSSSSDPVQCTRRRPSDANNQVALEYLDRVNSSYNPAIVTVQDAAAVNTFGLRVKPTSTLHMFTLVGPAITSAQFQLGREAVRNTYTFTVGQEYVLLDPMDVIAITDPALGLNAQWVRITEITEQQDSSLVMTAEDYLGGTHHAARYASQASSGFTHNANADPGTALSVVIWEPTYELASGLAVWIAVTGGADWAGCAVYISTDNTSYTLAGTLSGQSLAGTLAAALPSITAATTGPTIDTTDTLSVTMAGAGQLLSGSANDMLVGNTTCFVDGEYIAYETTTLGTGTAYAVTTLNRGLQGSRIAAHGAGTPFVRLLPGTIFELAVTADRIGQVLYVKVVGFNPYGGNGPQTVATSAVYSHTVTGLALAEPPAAPTNPVLSYVAGVEQLSWTEITDWRAVLYELRYGNTWTTAQFIQRVAHPPVQIPGNGQYWLAAYANPVPAIEAWSAPVALDVLGAFLGTYAKGNWDEYATGWTGALGGSAAVSGGAITVGGAGAPASGTYTIPAGHEIDVGYVCACGVSISWTGVSKDLSVTNFFGITDFFGVTDLLGGALSANGQVYPQIALSQDGTTWGAWQNYVPGAYSARKFNARIVFVTTDGQTTALLSAFTFSVWPPARVDHFTLAVSGTSTAVVFKPDGAPSTAPFNAGPPGAALPSVAGTIIAASAGDQLIIASLTPSGCTVEVVNGGSPVSRTVHLQVSGY